MRGFETDHLLLTGLIKTSIKYQLNHIMIIFHFGLHLLQIRHAHREPGARRRGQWIILLAQRGNQHIGNILRALLHAGSGKRLRAKRNPLIHFFIHFFERALLLFGQGIVSIVMKDLRAVDDDRETRSHELPTRCKKGNLPHSLR